MAIKEPAAAKPKFLDKAELRRLAEANHAALGIKFDPSVTVEQVRQLMLDDGIRPEDNEFSSEIIRARYEGE